MISAHRTDLMAAPSADAEEKGMQWTRRFGCRPGCLARHGARA
jgi:hypothetical protein